MNRKNLYSKFKYGINKPTGLWFDSDPEFPYRSTKVHARTKPH